MDKNTGCYNYKTVEQKHHPIWKGTLGKIKIRYSIKYFNHLKSS